MTEGNLYLRKCPVCRKKFEVCDADSWGYKKSKRFFCSYNCLRRYEKAHEKEKDGAMDLGRFADELFEAGWPADEVQFKVIGSVKYFDDLGFQQSAEICEIGQIYDISRNAKGKLVITLEVC